MVGFLIGITPVLGFDFHTDPSGVYAVTWAPGDLEMEIKMPAAPVYSDGSTPVTAMQAAFELWNQELGTLQFVPHVSAGTQYNLLNGINEVVMDSTIDGYSFGESTLAVAVYFRDIDRKVESDVIFNTAFSWDSYRGALRDSAVDIRRVAVHEFGHVIGLKHPDQAQPAQFVSALMNSVVSDVDELQADDIAGGHYLYGAPGFVPPNDAFTNAVSLAYSGQEVSVTGTNINSTRESGEPQHDAGGGRSVWWKFTPSVSGELFIDTKGSNFDTTLAVYTGNSVFGLTQVGSNDDEPNGRSLTSRLTLNVLGGVEYRVAVDGWIGRTGQIKLTVGTLTPIGFPRITVHPANRVIPFGGSTQFEVVAEGESPLVYQWQRSVSPSAFVNLTEGAPYQGTTSNRLVISDAGPELNGVRYRVVVSNNLGQVLSNSASLNLAADALTIVSLSGNLDLELAENGSLVVVVAGAANPQYQWFRNEVEIPGAEGNFANLNIFGAQARDSGIYQVRVRSADGFQEVWSDEIVVTVNTGPGAVRVSHGDRVVFIVRADGTIVRSASGKIQPIHAESVPLRENGVQKSGFRTALLRNHELWEWERSGFSGVDPDPEMVAGGVADIADDSTYFLKRNGDVWRFDDAKLDPDNDRYGPIAHFANQVAGGYYLDQDYRLWWWKDSSVIESWIPQILGDNVAAMDVEGSQTLMVKRDGSMWITGGDGVNSSPFPTFAQVNIDSVVDVSAGALHSLFLRSDGSLWGMGSNDYGQLGQGNTNSVTMAAPVQIDTQVVTMTAGDGQSFYVKTDGSVWAMGYNYSGALGYPGSEHQLSPVELYEGPVSAPAAPVNFNVSDDTVLSTVQLNWDPVLGASYYEIYRGPTDFTGNATLLTGRVEGTSFLDGSAAPGVTYYYWIRAYNPGGYSAFTGPVAGKMVSLLPTFVTQPEDVSIWSGGIARFAVKVAASPHAQLEWQWKRPGESSWTSLESIGGSYVQGALSDNLTQQALFAPDDQTQYRCVATNAVGATISNVVTLTVADPASPGSAFTQADAGDHILTINDREELWGRAENFSGQLGDGTRQDSEWVPVLIATEVVDAAVGRYHSLFLKSDGSLWGMGLNTEWPLGRGLDREQSEPQLLARGVVAIDAGWGQSLYLTRDGELYSLGRNPATNADALAEPRLLGTDVARFSIGDGYYLFTTSEGALWGAGDFTWGRLGGGYAPGQRSDPVYITGNVMNPVAGGSASLLLKYGGDLWGAGDAVALGLVASTSTHELMARNIAHASATGRRAVWVTRENVMWGAGFSSEGQLGVSGVKPRGILRQNVASATTTGGFTFFNDTDGALWGMGDNDPRKFGEMAENNIITPTQIHPGPFNAAQPVFDLRAGEHPRSGGAMLSWLPRPDHASFDIYRSTGNDFSASEMIAETIPGPFFHDFDPITGQAANYWVVATGFDNSTAPAFVSLTLPAQTKRHASDYNGDGRIEEDEVSRTAELYQAVAGTQRSGKYYLRLDTADGFWPAPENDPSTVRPIYHSADVNRDGSISQAELLRVIELHNATQAGGGQGAYIIDESTEDGFAPAP